MKPIKSSKNQNNLFVRKIAVFAFLILCVVSLLPAKAYLDISHDEITVSVSNIPVNTPNIFVPINVSSKNLEIQKVELKEVFVKGYVASIEKDERGDFFGISFTSLKGKSLPEQVDILVKVRPVKEANLIRPGFENKKQASKGFYEQVTINWVAPWVFTKVAKQIPFSNAGFDSISLATAIDDDLTKKDLKKRKKEQENKDGTFHIKSFGQTLVREERGKGIKVSDEDKTKTPYLREMSFFAFLPITETLQKIYIPVLIKDPESVKISVLDPEFQRGALLRLLDNDLLEFSPIAVNQDLPQGVKLMGKMQVRQNDQSLVNDIAIGPVLSEPSRPVSKVSVSILPSSIVIQTKSSIF